MKNSQPEANTRTAWHAIALRYADTVSNDFIDLGGAAWLTAEEGQREWNRIPVSADKDGPF